MKFIAAFVLVVAMGLAKSASAQVAGVALKSQWFTGSLEAPSPALPKAGLLAVEPYAIYTADTGAYDDQGHFHSTPTDLNQTDLLLVLKYGITDRLSIEALPSAAHSRNGHASATGIGDLPVELEYRLKDLNSKTGAPSVTFDLGMSFPTGDYDRLHIPLDGLGSGAFTLKEGVVVQSLFETPGNHPLRLRVYGAAYEPVAKVSVDDLSVYGTSLGFRGQALPGDSAVLGLGAGYSLSRRVVLALDVAENYSEGFEVNGVDAQGVFVRTNGASSSSLGIAPAIEYSWSGKIGVIAGVEFSAAGRNSLAYVAPQIALSMAF